MSSPQGARLRRFSKARSRDHYISSAGIKLFFRDEMPFSQIGWWSKATAQQVTTPSRVSWPFLLFPPARKRAATARPARGCVSFRARVRLPRVGNMLTASGHIRPTRHRCPPAGPSRRSELGVPRGISEQTSGFFTSKGPGVVKSCAIARYEKSSCGKGERSLRRT